MTQSILSSHENYIIEREHLQHLLDALLKLEYTVVGPTIRDRAIVYEPITSLDELPIGWTDDQEAGRYTLKKRNDAAVFGYNLGPTSWKRYLYPPRTQLWQAKQNKEGYQFTSQSKTPQKLALLGIRSCEMEAIFIQDRVLMSEHYKDPFYSAQRKNLLIVAINCAQACPTCFCDSMKTGPKIKSGFDLALTEIVNQERHYYLVEVATDVGKSLLTDVPHEKAKNNEIKTAEEVIDKTTKQMSRKMETSGLKEVLYKNYDHPRWDEVAKRCLTCANCTMVCPTCFCSSVEDTTDLGGEIAERWRRWDSCFNVDFSYIHGGAIRSSPKSRYRQWLTHKLATWQDQFDTSGCVGCGRCITWCPVGIDLTEEVQQIRQNQPTS